MNMWFGVIALLFILITTIAIYIKRRKIRNVIWNIIRFIVAGISLYVGQGASEVLEILIFGAIIGACLLISIMHAYNMLFTSGMTYDPVGVQRKPKSFGNDYWE